MDAMLETLREQSSIKGEKEEEAESKLIYMIHKTDNLEAIVWQLYDDGFRPNIKYGAVKLSWVSLTATNRTIIIKSQQMIDWAIDGMMEVQDTGVFNRLQDAKTELHYQLFKSEHKSYYNAQNIEILDECRTAANVGWLHSLVGVSLSRKHRPPSIPKGSLAEIDISKAYAGAFMRISPPRCSTSLTYGNPTSRRSRSIT